MDWTDGRRQSYIPPTLLGDKKAEGGGGGGQYKDNKKLMKNKKDGKKGSEVYARMLLFTCCSSRTYMYKANIPVLFVKPDNVVSHVYVKPDERIRRHNCCTRRSGSLMKVESIAVCSPCIKQ